MPKSCPLTLILSSHRNGFSTVRLRRLPSDASLLCACDCLSLRWTIYVRMSWDVKIPCQKHLANISNSATAAKVHKPFKQLSMSLRSCRWQVGRLRYQRDYAACTRDLAMPMRRPIEKHTCQPYEVSRSSEHFSCLRERCHGVMRIPPRSRSCCCFCGRHIRGCSGSPPRYSWWKFVTLFERVKVLDGW